MKVGELLAQPPKILIYGPPGTGKTALLLTLGADLQYWDLDDNTDVAFGLHDQYRDTRLGVDVLQFIDRVPKKGLAFPALKKHLLTVQTQCATKNFPYKVVGVDSLSALAVMSQRMVMCNSGRPGDNPEIQHWGMLLNDIENVITDLRALPILVFYIAHQTTFTSKDINQIQIAMPGQKLPGRVTRMFSEIWYTRLQPTGAGCHDFILQTTPTSTITCRSGRGLDTGTVFAKSDAKGKPVGTVGLWEIMDKIQRKETAPAA